LLAPIALMTVVLVILPVRSARPSPRAETAALPIKLRSVLVPVIAYGCFNLLASADVLLAYVLLNRNQLGVYIASSLLPKAIVTITLPVAQVLLPVLAAPASSSQTLRTAVLKALSVVLMLAGCASAVLWMGAAMVCNEQFGIRFCDMVSERSHGQHPTISSLPGSNESMIEVGAPIK